MTKRKKQHTYQELHKLFDEGHEQDRPIFSEHRTNSQLYNGNHYGSKVNKFDRNVKDFYKDSSQGIRVTENHINKLVRSIANAIKSQVPDVTVKPRNMESMSDQKKAEMHRAVLEDWKDNACFKDQEQKFIKEWVIFGEMAVKLTFDPEKGRRLPDVYVQEIELDVEDKKKGVEVEIDAKKLKRITRFEGDVIAEMIAPYDLIRPACAESYKDAEWLAIKKLVKPEVLKEMVGDSEEKLSMIHDSATNHYKTFRVNGEYTKTDNQVLVREFYFRPNYRYPNGHYFITVGGAGGGILFEGDLPKGIFPIEVLGYDEISTSPRHSSIIRQLRPNQLQINLMKSKHMEHVLKMGDDVVFIQKGSKITNPTKRNGMVVSEYVGAQPIIQGGRVGGQYLEPITANVETMYIKAGLPELLEEKSAQNLDAHTALYRSAKQKVRFSEYVCKYETFLKRMFLKVLRLKKGYTNPDAIIEIIGKDEIVNIPEFKSSDDLGFEICLEGQTEDAESKLGRSLDLQKILQYGANFDPSQLGLLIKQMPYLNNEAIYEEFTQDYQNLRNDICRLDRGDAAVLEVNPYENHDFVINGLINRIKKPDFEFLPDQIQALYQQKLQIHEQVKADQLAQARAIEADFIPTGGALIGVDMYENAGLTTRGDPKVRRVRLPQEAVEWLRQRLKQQGLQLEILESQQAQVQADIANQVLAGEQQAQQDQQLQQLLADPSLQQLIQP